SVAGRHRGGPYPVGAAASPGAAAGTGRRDLPAEAVRRRQRRGPTRSAGPGCADEPRDRRAVRGVRAEAGVDQGDELDVELGALLGDARYRAVELRVVDVELVGAIGEDRVA